MQPAALAARELADDFLLVAALEVEAAEVGARGHRELAHRDHVVAPGDLLEHCLVRRQHVARLVHIGELHGLADLHFARGGLFFARDHAEQRRLARAVRADHADDRTRRYLERKLVDEQALTVALGHVDEFDDLIAQPFGHGDEDLRGFVALLAFVRGQLVESREAGLGFRLAPLGILADPFELGFHRAHVRVFLLGLGLEALLLLLEPRGIIAFPRNAFAAIEFEDPIGGVVEEIAVVGYRHDGPREALQELFEPVHALGIQMVGRLVE